jgi:hypothetical protein
MYFKGAYLDIFYQKIRNFPVFLRFFSSFFRFFRLYTETESFDVSIEPKQAEDPPKQFKREYFLYKRYIQLSHLIPVTTHILNVVYTCVSVVQVQDS